MDLFVIFRDAEVLRRVKLTMGFGCYAIASSQAPGKYGDADLCRWQSSVELRFSLLNTPRRGYRQELSAVDFAIDTVSQERSHLSSRALTIMLHPYGRIPQTMPYIPQYSPCE